MEQEWLYIRADGNKNLGMGHLMRCFVIAEEWGKEKVCFIVSDENSEKLVNERNFLCINLQSDWKDLDSEIGSIGLLLQEKKITLLLLDSYYYSEKYTIFLKKYCRVAAFGEPEKGKYPVDMIIDYNIYANQYTYHNSFSNSTIEFLLGTKYFPLRQEFRGKHVPDRDQKTTIFLTTGSTDQLEIIPSMVIKLLNYNFYVKVVTGKFNRQLSLLKSLEEKFDGFQCYIDANNISDIILKCDIAISAAGITLYELCYMGIPTITFSFVDNQVEGAMAMQKKKIMFSVGDMRNNREQKVEQVIDYVLQLREEKSLWKNLAQNMRSYVDDKGAERVIHKIKSYEL